MVLMLTAASACVRILHFGEAKHEIDTVEQRVTQNLPWIMTEMVIAHRGKCTFYWKLTDILLSHCSLG